MQPADLEGNWGAWAACHPTQPLIATQPEYSLQPPCPCKSGLGYKMPRMPVKSFIRNCCSPAQQRTPVTSFVAPYAWHASLPYPFHRSACIRVHQPLQCPRPCPMSCLPVAYLLPMGAMHSAHRIPSSGTRSSSLQAAPWRNHNYNTLWPYLTRASTTSPCIRHSAGARSPCTVLSYTCGVPATQLWLQLHSRVILACMPHFLLRPGLEQSFSQIRVLPCHPALLCPAAPTGTHYQGTHRYVGKHLRKFVFRQGRMHLARH